MRSCQFSSRLRAALPNQMAAATLWLAATGLFCTPSLAQQPASQLPPVELVPTPAVPAASQLAQQSAQLHGLALALKAEMEKTTVNMLSAAVSRKAEAIEKLARAMKEGKPVQGSNPKRGRQ